MPLRARERSGGLAPMHGATFSASSPDAARALLEFGASSQGVKTKPHKTRRPSVRRPDPQLFHTIRTPEPPSLSPSTKTKRRPSSRPSSQEEPREVEEVEPDEHAQILSRVDGLIAPYDEPERIMMYDLDVIKYDIEDLLVTQQRRMQKRNLALENAKNSISELASDDELDRAEDHNGDEPDLQQTLKADAQATSAQLVEAAADLTRDRAERINTVHEEEKKLWGRLHDRTAQEHGHSYVLALKLCDALL